ncbi:MAG: DUF1476 domain-containing protein [Bosea sp. (in: a-proteobacteria)]
MNDAAIHRAIDFHVAHPGWRPKEDTRDTIRARRNVLTALWAGRLMGLPGSALSAYATEAHIADFETAGDEDIVRKLSGDLNALGFFVSGQMVRGKLIEFHAQALRESALTD